VRPEHGVDQATEASFGKTFRAALGTMHQERHLLLVNSPPGMGRSICAYTYGISQPRVLGSMSDGVEEASSPSGELRSHSKPVRPAWPRKMGFVARDTNSVFSLPSPGRCTYRQGFTLHKCSNSSEADQRAVCYTVRITVLPTSSAVYPRLRSKETRSRRCELLKDLLCASGDL
jgi:hypothetical protein